MYGEEKTTLINLTSHEQYLDILKKLKSKTAYIVLVQIDGEDKNDLNLVKALKQMELIGTKKVNEWLGTRTRGFPAVRYIFKFDERYIKYLSNFDSFFFNTTDKWSYDAVEKTDFGFDDIAFLDENRQVLFYTTTHEGYANILPDLMD
ncbi:hypothetical protein ACPWSR_07715 [Alloiococcus sp. CFN-8]|uniref:hypothetical protein n=1 Tax=Alloiococcus sp. CFN-8 TaxID=3416081 RepID=UPI003CF38238